MERVKISEYMLRKAIMKTDAFKGFVAEYKERMKSFRDGYYYEAVRLKYAVTLEITFAYHNPDWENEKKQEVYKNAFLFDDTIIANYDFRERPSNVFAKLMTRHILDMITLKKISPYHIIDGITVECPWCHIDMHHAWSSEEVGTYYIEQECGEGWIMLPKNPEVCVRNYINISE